MQSSYKKEREIVLKQYYEQAIPQPMVRTIVKYIQVDGTVYRDTQVLDMNGPTKRAIRI